MDIFLIILAIVPALILAFMVYRKDIIEREPFGLLLKLFGFGALSIISAVILEMLGEEVELLFSEEGSVLYAFVDCFLVVAIAEELGKYVALKKGSWKNKNFNYSFDAMVYAVCVGIGFAIPENVLYVADGGLSTALLRTVTSIPGHVSFAVYMGYYFGEAKVCEQKNDMAGKKSNLRKAFWIPVLLHGFYDFLLSVDYTVAIIVFAVFVIVLDVRAIKLVKMASKNDRAVYPDNYISVNGNNYVIDSLLGNSECGNNYLVHSIDGNESYVVKQFNCYATENPVSNKFREDTDAYNRLITLGIPMPSLYEDDYENVRFRKQYIEGPTVDELLTLGSLQESILEQMRKMCEILYANGLNINYDPKNFVVSNEILYYIDYECMPYTEEQNFENYGITLWRRENPIAENTDAQEE